MLSIDNHTPIKAGERFVLTFGRVSGPVLGLGGRLKLGELFIMRTGHIAERVRRLNDDNAGLTVAAAEDAPDLALAFRLPDYTVEDTDLVCWDVARAPGPPEWAPLRALVHGVQSAIEGTEDAAYAGAKRAGKVLDDPLEKLKEWLRHLVATAETIGLVAAGGVVAFLVVRHELRKRK